MFIAFALQPGQGFQPDAVAQRGVGQVNHEVAAPVSERAGGGGALDRPDRVWATACTFTENEALGSGGGLSVEDNRNVDILDCAFVANRAGVDGGGVSFTRGRGFFSPITGTTFHENVAGGNGGGVACIDTRTTVDDCRFEANAAV